MYQVENKFASYVKNRTRMGADLTDKRGFFFFIRVYPPHLRLKILSLIRMGLGVAKSFL